MRKDFGGAVMKGKKNTNKALAFGAGPTLLKRKKGKTPRRFFSPEADKNGKFALEWDQILQTAIPILSWCVKKFHVRRG